MEPNLFYQSPLSSGQNQVCQNPGRTADTLCDIGKNRQQGHPDRRFRADLAGEDDTERAV